MSAVRDVIKRVTSLVYGACAVYEFFIKSIMSLDIVWSCYLTKMEGSYCFVIEIVILKEIVDLVIDCFHGKILKISLIFN